MSLSVDYAKLESVMQFANFLDVLKNPGELKTTLAELQVATVEYKKLVEAKSKLDQVDAYVADGQAQVRKLRQALEVEQGDLAVQLSAKVKSEAEFAQYMSDANEKLSAKQVALSIKLTEFEKREVALQNLEATATAKQKALDSQKASQDELQAELNAKAAKLKALLV